MTEAHFAEAHKNTSFFSPCRCTVTIKNTQKTQPCWNRWQQKWDHKSLCWKDLVLSLSKTMKLNDQTFMNNIRVAKWLHHLWLAGDQSMMHPSLSSTRTNHRPPVTRGMHITVDAWVTNWEKQCRQQGMVDYSIHCHTYIQPVMSFMAICPTRKPLRMFWSDHWFGGRVAQWGVNRKNFFLGGVIHIWCTDQLE